MTRKKKKKKQPSLQRTLKEEEHRVRRIAVFVVFALFLFAISNFIVISIWGESFLGGFPEDTPPMRVAIDPQDLDDE